MVMAITIYLAIGLAITMWCDGMARKLYGHGCPSIRAGLVTTIIWLPLVLTALLQIYQNRR